MALAKYLTFEERKQIEKHIKNGCSYSETARLIGRSLNGVTVEVKRSGDRNYSAKVGQDIADNLKNRSKNPPVLSVQKRIENLEMQVEILHDTLKGLLNK